ncbi:MAG: MMPL family transporter [Planctomycetes bacterium]|nr:MMPL family transporter [Planctomycetota bacterium]MCB9934196.1 MMPL family transporter [Planctomycetota bacterium]
MRGPFEQLFDFLNRRPLALPIVVVLLLAAAVVGALRIDFEEDVFALLPRDEPLVSEAQLAIKRYRGLERIVVALESDEPAKLAAAVDQADAALRKLEGIREVVSRIDQAAQQDIAELYMSKPGDPGKTPLLFDEAMQAQVEARLNADWYRKALQAYVDGQAGAEGIKIVKTFPADPFGFDELTLRRFEKLNSGFAGKSDAQGRILSADGRLAILLVEADFPSSNTGKGRALMHALDDALAQLPEGVTPHVIGAHRSSVDNAEVLRTDMHLTIATSVIAILLLFLLAFRALTPILVTLLSVGFGFAMALGSQGLVHGELSAITAGFAAVLLGIAVDYGIHLVTTYGSLDGEREERARLAIRHVGRPGFVAMLTTVAAVAMLRFSEFDGLHQLAEMAVAGIAGSLAFAFTAGPQLLRRMGPKPRAALAISGAVGALQRGRRRLRWPLLGVIGAITLVLAAFVPSVGFDGDVLNLDGKSEQTRASETLVAQTFGQETLSRTLVVVGGVDLEQALRQNDLAAHDLHAMGAKYESAAWVLPALQTQQDNVARWRRFWSEQRIEQVRKLVTETGVPHPNQPGQLLKMKESRLQAFFDKLKLTQEPQPLDAAKLKERPVWLLLGNFISEQDGRWYIGTTAQLDASRMGELKARQPAAVVLNKAAFVGRMVQFIQHDLLYVGGISLLLVLVVLWLTFRNPREVAIALVPVAGGMAWTLGLMALLGIPFNIINTLVTVFIAGLGIDYGIFFVQTYRGSDSREHADERLKHAGAGVLVAALTTLFGFGSLALAQHPALFSVGVTTALGVTSALVLTLAVVPTLLEIRGRHES